VNDEPPAFALKLWLGLFAVGGFEIVRVLLTIVVAMLRN
jgi:phycobilisome rod-core linker protein